MLSINNFTRFGNNIYTFTYTLGDIKYSSAICFSEPSTEQLFEQLFPAIRETLIWLESNTESIKKQVGKNLPQGVDIEFFETLHIASFSLFVDVIENNLLTINIAYGDSNNDIYILSSIKNKEVSEVSLNT